MLEPSPLGAVEARVRLPTGEVQGMAGMMDPQNYLAVIKVVGVGGGGVNLSLIHI